MTRPTSEKQEDRLADADVQVRIDRRTGAYTTTRNRRTGSPTPRGARRNGLRKDGTIRNRHWDRGSARSAFSAGRL